MAKARGTSVAARFDPDPQHLLLTKVEFDRLCEVARIPEKENFFFLVGLLVPCSLNVFAVLPKGNESPSLGLILNFIVVVVAALLAFFQARGWYAKRKTFKTFVADLEERPEGRLAFTPEPSRMYVNADAVKGAG